MDALPLSSDVLNERRGAPPRAWIYVSLAFCVLAVAAYFTVDRWLVEWIHRHGVAGYMKKELWWIRKRGFVLTWPGHFACTVAIALIVALVRRPDWRPSVLVLMSGAMSGSNALLKWIFGRSRPSYEQGAASMDFEPFRGGIGALFTQRNLSFPSGDTALAAATAACLTFLFPRWWAVWWFLAMIVAAQRLAELAHHASDVLAATALGIVAFQLAKVVCGRLPRAARA